MRAFSRSNFAKEHNPGGLRPWIVIDSTVALDALNRESPSTCFGEDSDIEFSRIEVGGDIRQLLVTRHQSNAALFIASNGFTFEKIQESIGDDSIQRVVVMGIEKLVGQQLATDPTEILGSSDQIVFRGHRCEELPRLVSEMLPESLVPSFGSTSSRLSARCYPIWAPAIGSNLH